MVDNGGQSSANQMSEEGGTDLLIILPDVSSQRSRSRGDEDGAHQGIVSLKY